MENQKERIDCPDPLVHHHNKTLQEQASTAALLAVKSSHEHGSPDALQPSRDANLSSAGASMGFRHAESKDRTAYATVHSPDASSASAAATVASANPKHLEVWKPNRSRNANQAAQAANSQPTHTLNSNQTTENSTPHSLAGGALSATQLTAVEGASHKDVEKVRSPRLQAKRDVEKAAAAATGASSRRPRSGSTPLPVSSHSRYLLSDRAALSAASAAHNPHPAYPTTRDNLHVSDQSFHHQDQASDLENQPKVAPSGMSNVATAEEQAHRDALKASSISMAKLMFEFQKSHIEELNGTPPATLYGTSRTSEPGGSKTNEDVKTQAMQYIQIQNAAKKLAAQRLEKIRKDDIGAYRDYYGYRQPKKHNVLHRGRRRASSEGQWNQSDDKFKPRAFGTTSSDHHFQSDIADQRKRQEDRAALMLIAEKKVHEKMDEIDKRVFESTGRVPQAMMEEWESIARAKAEAGRKERSDDGRVDVGGGRYLEQADIDSIAVTRVQPAIEAMNKVAEERRAREEQQRSEKEEKRNKRRREKSAERESDTGVKESTGNEGEVTRHGEGESKASTAKKSGTKMEKIRNMLLHREHGHKREQQNESGVEGSDKNTVSMRKGLGAEKGEGRNSPEALGESDPPEEDEHATTEENDRTGSDHKSPRRPILNISRGLRNKIRRHQASSAEVKDQEPKSEMTAAVPLEPSIEDGKDLNHNDPSIQTHANLTEPLAPALTGNYSVSNSDGSQDNIPGTEPVPRTESSIDELRNSMPSPLEIPKTDKRIQSPVRETRFHEEV